MGSRSKEEMKLLDEFAKAALQGLLASDSGGPDGSDIRYFNNQGHLNSAKAAEDAYSIAEAMLDERKDHQ